MTSSCLKICGDCGEREELARLQPHRHEEVARALGSRLPVTIGVSMSMNPSRSISSRMIRSSWRERRMLRCMRSRRRSRQRYFRRSGSSTPSSSSWKGSGVRARDDLELVHLDLDLAGGDVRVDGLRRAADDLAASPARRTRIGSRARTVAASGARSGLTTSCDDARVVAQVDEDQARRGRGGARPSRRA